MTLSLYTKIYFRYITICSTHRKALCGSLLNVNSWFSALRISALICKLNCQNSWCSKSRISALICKLNCQNSWFSALICKLNCQNSWFSASSSALICKLNCQNSRFSASRICQKTSLNFVEKQQLSIDVIQAKLYIVEYSKCSGCETRAIVINLRAYMYINPRTVSVENAPIVFMKYSSLS